MGMASDITMLIIGRAITGMAAGTWVLLVVTFSSLFPPEDVVRATAILTFVGSIGKMLATAITGSLNNWGGYSLAFFLATSAAGLAILIMLPVHEHRRLPQRPSVQNIGTLLIRRDVLLPSLLNGVIQYSGWSSVYGFIPILARQLGATDVMQSVLISMNIAVVVIGNTVAATIVKQIGPRCLLYLSFVFLATGLGIAAITSTLFLVFVALFCVGLAWGIGYPLLMGMSIEHVADTERATAMGLHQAIYAIGMFSGPWLSGILADIIGIQSTLGVNAFACLMFGLLGTYWLSKTRESNDSK
jgi:predicted MFS family arabinose efflux permease